MDLVCGGQRPEQGLPKKVAWGPVQALSLPFPWAFSSTLEGDQNFVLVIAGVSPLKVPCCKSFFIKLNTIYINLIFYVEVSGETLGRHKSGTDTK